MSFEFKILVTAAACNLLLAGVVFFRSWRRLDNALFLCLALSVAVWSVGIAYFLESTTQHQARVLVNCYYFAAWCIGLSVWGFSYAWTGKSTAGLGRWLILLTLGLSVLLWADPRLIVTQVRFEPHLGVTFNIATQIAYSLGFLAFYGSGIYEIWRKHYRSTGFQRSQFELLLIGLGSAGLVGTICNLVLPWFGNYRLIWVGPISSVLFVGCIAYAIVRHHLFDIRALIVRSIAYLTTLTVLASMFGVIVFGTSTYLFQLRLDFWVQVYISAATALSALAFSRLKNFFDHVSNSLFYRDAYDAQDLLDRLNRLFVTNTDLERLLSLSGQTIAEVLKAEFCYFGVKESHHAPQRIIGSGVRSVSLDDIRLARSITPHIHQKLIVTDDLAPRHEEA